MSDKLTLVNFKLSRADLDDLDKIAARLAREACSNRPSRTAAIRHAIRHAIREAVKNNSRKLSNSC
jgi:plasmid stabilization system protein ParE